MRRRDLMTVLAGVALAAPRAIQAQPKKIPIVGLLSSHLVAGNDFQDGLGNAGFVEGKNVALEFSFAGDLYDRLPELAADLVRKRVDVIAAFGTTEAKVAVHATKTIPIVFLAQDDPVAEGLVASLARPGGNLTGVLEMDAELMPKRLDLLLELVPEAKVFALLVNPEAAYTPAVQRIAQEAARARKAELRIFTAGPEDDLEAVFTTVDRLKPVGLVVQGENFLLSRAVDGILLTLASRHAIPAIYDWDLVAVAGGLISYGPNREAAQRQMGAYVGRVLQGEKPADLPFVRPDKAELIINLGTAKALHLKLPPLLLAKADKVIN